MFTKAILLKFTSSQKERFIFVSMYFKEFSETTPQHGNNYHKTMITNNHMIVKQLFKNLKDIRINIRVQQDLVITTSYVGLHDFL